MRDRDTLTNEAPQLGWRVSDERQETGSCTGVWVRGADGPVAVFDLAKEQAWLLGGRGRRLWLEGDLANPVEAQLTVDLPVIAGAKAPDTRDGRDWVFEPELDRLPEAIGDEAYAELVLFDRHGFHLRRLPAEQDGTAWRVSEAETLVLRWEHLPDGLTWALEWRTDDGCLARSRGH